MLYGLDAPTDLIDYALLNGRAFVIFDGLDELLDVSLRRDIVQSVEAFAHRYPTTSILVTSRAVGYYEASLDERHFTTAILQDFDDDQVEAYVRKWFSLDESIEAPRKGWLAESFIKDSSFVADLRVNPLMLSLMCGIYASENYIPHNRPDVYEKCALLLFERWDKQRGIVSPMAFDAHVQAAMRSLALWLYQQQSAQEGISRAKLIQYMTRYLLEKRFDNEEEAEEAATQFIDFCKGRAWVLTDVGAERYGFTHRTFLEYFAASQLVRLHPSASGLFDALWPHILQSEWDVMTQLAVQTLGKTVEDGADDFLQLAIHAAADAPLAESGNLLSFAARSLSFIVPRPSVLKDLASATTGMLFDKRDVETSPQNVARWFGEFLAATKENLPLIERYLHDLIEQRLARDPDNEPVLRLALNMGDYIARGSGSGVAPSPVQPVPNRAYWRSASSRHRQEFARLIPRHADQLWLAESRVRDGSLSLEQFGRQFGIAGFYNSFRIGEVRPAPLCFPFVFLLISRRNGLSKEPWMTLEAARSVLDLALGSEAPWIDMSFRDFPESRSIFLHERPNVEEWPKLESTALSATVPMALPIAEEMAREMAALRIPGLGIGKGRRESAGRQIPLRRQLYARLVRGDGEAESVPTLPALDERVATLVEAWMAGRINLVVRSRPL